MAFMTRKTFNFFVNDIAPLLKYNVGDVFTQKVFEHFTHGYMNKEKFAQLSEFNWLSANREDQIEPLDELSNRELEGRNGSNTTAA